ncbi:hypothetical protein YC2023_098602 [Brassica napus]
MLQDILNFFNNNQNETNVVIIHYNFLLVQVNIKVQKHSLSMAGIESPIAFLSYVTKPKQFSNFLVSDFLKSCPETPTTSKDLSNAGQQRNRALYLAEQLLRGIIPKWHRWRIKFLCASSEMMTVFYAGDDGTKLESTFCGLRHRERDRREEIRRRERGRRGEVCCTEIDSCILKIDAYETTHTIVGAEFCLMRFLRQASIKP